MGEEIERDTQETETIDKGLTVIVCVGGRGGGGQNRERRRKKKQHLWVCAGINLVVAAASSAPVVNSSREEERRATHAHPRQTKPFLSATLCRAGSATLVDRSSRVCVVKYIYIYLRSTGACIYTPPVYNNVFMIFSSDANSHARGA